MVYLIILLVASLALLGSGFGGYRYGKHVCQGEQATAVATAQDKAIADANAATEASTARTVAAAKAEADARVRAAGIRRKGEIDANAKARPECARDSQSMELLQQSIASANGQTPAGNSLPDVMHADF